MSNVELERLAPPTFPQPPRSLLCAPFFFATMSFVTTTFDKFQFQSQVSLSQNHVVHPIRLKFELYAVFIEWDGRTNFLIAGQQDIHRDFHSKVSRNHHKKLAPKIAWHEYWEPFVKISHRSWLVCFADFVGMTLLAVLFLLPPHNYFLIVAFAHSLLCSWNFFYHFKPLQFLAQLLLSRQHPHVLQLGEYNHEIMKLLFTQ